MITVCVVFNHAFPTNIPFIREMLKDRFSDVVFIQPIHRSPDPDVMTSYRGSYNFQGMIADYAKTLMKKNSSHYIFIQDDVFLNPLFNETNIVEKLAIPKDGAFISGFGPAGGQINGRDYSGWSWIVGVLWKLQFPTNTVSGSGVQSFWRDFSEVAGQIEDIERRHNLKFTPFTYDPENPLPNTDPFGGNALNQELVRTIFKGVFSDGPVPTYTPPIPLCTGFSDFFVVDATILESLTHYFGVFAAANIFVEVAIPSSLVYSAAQIVQAKDIGLRTDWSYEADKVSHSQLIDGFQSDLLVVHPMKPSREADRMRHVKNALCGAR